LVKTEEEIALLDKLYGLYQKVKSTIGTWNETPWAEVQNEVPKMLEAAENFQRDCLRLPGSLKKWLTYTKLKDEVEEMIEVLPLVDGLAKDSIRDRHWEEVIELSKHDIPFNQDNFVLKQLLDAKLINIKEDCEDIADNADKQLKLENQLRNEISAYYDNRSLTIVPLNGVPSTIGGDIGDIQTDIEDHINQLNQMSVMRYVGPFKNEVLEKMGLLADVSDIIEKWLKVQSNWYNLVNVFIGGDIAKAMPQVAQRFLKVHKTWLKIMERANE
jgi:dynein heavy chain